MGLSQTRPIPRSPDSDNKDDADDDENVDDVQEGERWAGAVSLRRPPWATREGTDAYRDHEE